jgi:hypothetical protein
MIELFDSLGAVKSTMPRVDNLQYDFSRASSQIHGICRNDGTLVKIRFTPKSRSFISMTSGELTHLCILWFWTKMLALRPGSSQLFVDALIDPYL